MKQKMELRFGSEIYHVKKIVIQVLTFIQSHIPALSIEDYTDLRLVFSELLYNAVVHGNNGDLTKDVQLSVEIKNDVIFASVADEGVGFDYLDLLARIREEDDLMAEGGRGIRLVYSLTDRLSFNVTGNAIFVSKKVAPHG